MEVNLDQSLDDAIEGLRNKQKEYERQRTKEAIVEESRTQQWLQSVRNMDAEVTEDIFQSNSRAASKLAMFPSSPSRGGSKNLAFAGSLIGRGQSHLGELSESSAMPRQVSKTSFLERRKDSKLTIRTASKASALSRSEQLSERADDELSSAPSTRESTPKFKKPPIVYGATERMVEVCSLAKRLHMPVDTLQAACKIFEKHADVDAGMPLMSAELSTDNFMGVLGDLCTCGTIESLSPEYIEQAFATADRDGGGTIDLEEFAVWYSSHSFDEELSLTAQQLEDREVSRKLGIDLDSLDKYKRAFAEYDVDGGGSIDKDEFEGIVSQLLKIPAGQALPPERLDAFWREADADGGGDIDFEEFCVFYQKYFESEEGEESDPLGAYYKSYRQNCAAVKFEH